MAFEIYFEQPAADFKCFNSVGQGELVYQGTGKLIWAQIHKYHGYISLY